MVQLRAVTTEISGLSIKTKVSGTWQNAKPHVKVSGTWEPVRTVWSKVNGGWVSTYEHEYVYTFAAGTHTDVDLDTLGLDKFNHVRIVIPSNATLIASSTSTYALKTGTGYGGTLTIENNGVVYGRGGNGGGGGYQYPSAGSMITPEAGGSGGDAIHIENTVTIDNNGTILGGGGGGGGGEGTYIYRHAGGGGGGGGAPYGTGGVGRTANGSQSYNAANGATATLTSGGAGGAGARAVSGSVFFYGGTGGNGGNIGVDGSSGGFTPSSVTHSTGVGAGGADGTAYYNPSNFTITQI